MYCTKGENAERGGGLEGDTHRIFLEETGVCVSLETKHHKLFPEPSHFFFWRLNFAKHHQSFPKPTHQSVCADRTNAAWA